MAATASDAADALSLVRLHELVRKGRAELEKLARDLEDYDPRIVPLAADGLYACEERQRRIAAAVEAFADLGEMAYHERITFALRDCRPLAVTAESVAAAAVEWLVSGIADAQQLTLVARLLPAPDGPVAFARALVSTPHLAVIDATVRDVLRAFPGFPAAHVDRIGVDAHLNVDTPLNQLGGAAVHRLIEALARVAAQPHPNPACQ